MRAPTSPPDRVRARPGLLTAGVAVIALGFGFASTAGLWLALGGRMVTANVPDAIHYSWWLGHTVHALGVPESPFRTVDLNWPEGVSAMNNTTLLLPAVLLSPITLLANSLVMLNLLNVFAVPACALGGYWALRQVPLGESWPGGRLSRAAALVGGVAFAISPAIVNSLVGHVTMAFAPGLPVLVALGVRCWTTDRPLRAGLILGAVTTLQVFTGEEVLFQAAVGVVLVMLVAALSRPHAVGAGLKRLVIAVPAAFAVFLPIAGYPLYLQFFGPLKQTGSPFLLDYYGADVTAFTTPTGQALLHRASSAQTAQNFPGGLEEHLAYLGWPLLITALVTAVVARRRVPVRAAAIGLLVAMLLSLGGRLWISGEWTEHPGPYKLFQHLPVTEASLATRFGLLAALFAGAVLAFAVHLVAVQAAAYRPVGDRAAHGRERVAHGGVDAAPERDDAAHEGAARGPAGGLRSPLVSSRLAPMLAPLLAAVCLAPLLPRPLDTVEAPQVPAYFTTSARELPAESVAVVLPYPVAGNPVAMRWQSAAGYRFRMPGGYFLGPASDGHAYVGGSADPPTAALLGEVAETGVAVRPTDEQLQQARRDLRAWDADRVVLGPSPAYDALRDTVTALVGSAPTSTGGVDVWTDLPK